MNRSVFFRTRRNSVNVVLVFAFLLPGLACAQTSYSRRTRTRRVYSRFTGTRHGPVGPWATPLVVGVVSWSQCTNACRGKNKKKRLQGLRQTDSDDRSEFSDWSCPPRRENERRSHDVPPDTEYRRLQTELDGGQTLEETSRVRDSDRAGPRIFESASCRDGCQNRRGALACATEIFCTPLSGTVLRRAARTSVCNIASVWFRRRRVVSNSLKRRVTSHNLYNIARSPFENGAAEWTVSRTVFVFILENYFNTSVNVLRDLRF